MKTTQNPMHPYENQIDIATRKDFLAEMLQGLRKAKGFSQKEVANILEISPQTYNGYEKGRNEPPVEILVRLSYLFNVSIDVLVQRDRLHKKDESAMISVAKLQDEISELKEAFANDPTAKNIQLQTLIAAMEALTEANKKLIEKAGL